MIEGTIPDGTPPLSGRDPGEKPSEEIEIRIEEIADAFLEKAQAGLAPDCAAAAARHPELAPWLERRLKLIAMMQVVGRSTASIARVHCPHCGNPTVIDHLEPQATCSSCGSTFRIQRRPGAASSPGAPAREHRSLPGALAPRTGRLRSGLQGPRSRAVAHGRREGPAGRSSSPSAQDEDRFLREARHAAQLRHPSSWRSTRSGSRAASPTSSASFIEGETLAERMVRDRPGRKEAARLMARGRRRPRSMPTARASSTAT